MDFSLLERHPWATTGIIVGGGFLLYLVLRRPSSTSDPSAGTSYTGVGVDPQTAQLQAQASAQAAQASTYVAGLQLQGATQISLAQIGADVTKFNTGASAETIDNQTAAQLALGLGQINGVVEQTRINAGLQSKYIDAIIAAFGGNSSPVVTPTPTTTVTTGPTGATSTTSQNLPPQPVSFPTPVYNVAPSFGGVNPGTNVPGTFGNPYTDGSIPAGGTPLLPSYTVPYCDPRDTSCVMNNVQTSINWENADIAANNTVIRNQCLANAARNIGQPNYAALVAACG